jgi:hypothetical protein
MTGITGIFHCNPDTSNLGRLGEVKAKEVYAALDCLGSFVLVLRRGRAPS